MSYILEIRILRNCVRFRVAGKGLRGAGTVEENELQTVFSERNREVIVGTLNDMKEKYRLRHAEVYLPFFMCLSNILDLPFTKKTDIGDALVFQLEDVLPLPLEEYVYDFNIIAKDRTSSKVLALCVRKDIVTDISDMIASAGLTVASVRCGFMGDLSAVYGGRKKQSFLFVNIEAGDIYMAVVRGGTCIALKHLGNADRLGSEIESIRDIHDIRDVFLTGDVTDSIRTDTGVSSINVQDGARRIIINSPFVFEFLKPGTGFNYRYSFWRFAAVAAAVSAIMIIAGYFIPVYRDYSALNNVNTRIMDIKKEASGLITKRKELDMAVKRLKFLRGKQARRTLDLNIMSEISRILPKDAWVISFNVDEKGFIELKGFSDNPSEVVEKLEQSKMFRNVGFSAPIIKAGGNTRYSVKMELET